MVRLAPGQLRTVLPAPGRALTRAEEAELKKLLARTARANLREAIERGIASETYRTIVNGRVGAREESVELPGPIVHRFDYMRDIAIYALEFLRRRSPVDSGRYRNSHFVLANGAEAAPEQIPFGLADIMITNDQPYARKIHVGAQRLSVPPFIYEDARQSVQRRFGNVVRVQVRFIELQGGYVLKRGGTRRLRSGRVAGRRDVRAGQRLTYPALLIERR